jgi:hypothetical protein
LFRFHAAAADAAAITPLFRLMRAIDAYAYRRHAMPFDDAIDSAMPFSYADTLAFLRSFSPPFLPPCHFSIS